MASLYSEIAELFQGGNPLKERMRRRKVFLPIDNVWDNQQSREEALVFLQAGFHPDNMVLVTAATDH